MSGMLQFDGMRLADIAALAGESLAATRSWLRRQGYVVPDQVVRRIQTASEIDDEIKARPATRTSCFLCGARSCAHQGAE